MSGFSIAWLDLRESADFSARNKMLATQALEWLNKNPDTLSSKPIIVDLGAGTGSTLRALTMLDAKNMLWRLVDLDCTLLDEAIRRHGKSHLIENYQVDLALVHKLPLIDAQLVTASAFFDLASRKFIDDLVAKLTQHNAGLYAALNYDGTTEWVPEHPLDKVVLEAFNKDQHRDKGLGPALGPDAVSYLTTALESSGYSVVIAPSPWALNSKDSAMVCELINGIAGAVATGYGIETVMLEEWKTYRLAHVESGSCSVGHLDLLALPPSSGA
jgi:hypothetical protein